MKKVIYECKKCHTKRPAAQMGVMPCPKCTDKMIPVKVANKNVGK